MAGFLFKSPSYQLVDANGDVYPGAKINFYLTGTTTRSDSYQDSGLATPHTNPVVANTAGLFAPIYLDPDVSYKVVVTDADDVVLQTIDPAGIELGTGNAPLKDLTPSADKGIYYTSGTAAALFDLTEYGRSISGVANEVAFKALTNLTIGEDVQAYDEDLDDLSALTHAAGKIIYSDGTDWTTLNAGTADYVLQSNGAAAPSWVIKDFATNYINLDLKASKTIGASAGAKSTVKSVAVTAASGDLVVIRITEFTCADPNTGNANIFANLWIEKDSTGSAMTDANSVTMSDSGSAGGVQSAALDGIIFDAVSDSDEHTYAFKVWSNSTTGNTSAIRLIAEIFVLPQATVDTTFDF